MSRTHRAERLPSPEVIREGDEIDVTPNEYYVRHAAEQADRAAEASGSVKSQRDAEYKFAVAILALIGLIKSLEAMGDARL